MVKLLWDARPKLATTCMDIARIYTGLLPVLSAALPRRVGAKPDTSMDVIIKFTNSTETMSPLASAENMPARTVTRMIHPFCGFVKMENGCGH